MLQCLILGVLLAVPSQDTPRFDCFGTMDSLLAGGVKIAPVSKGLPFDITLTNGGSSISSTEFDLKPAGSDKPFHLSLSGLAFSDGHVKGQAEIKNDSGKSIQGVRLDVVTVSETYKATDDQGQPIQKTRSVDARLPSPLSYGDVADGESNGQLPFDVSTIDFKPETVSISIHGVVSGVQLARFIHVDAGSNSQIEVDAAGKIYVSDVSNNCVSRVDGDGSNLVQLCKLPDQCKGMGVNPLTGEVAANCTNFKAIYLFDKDGVDSGKIGEDVLESWSDYQRYDAKGRLWTNSGAAYVMFGADRKVSQKIEKFGDFDPTGDRFDVAPDGTLYAVSNHDTVLVRHPDGKGGVFAKGTGDKLGQLFGADSVRVGPDGLVYVAEDGANDTLYGTVTAFDASGRVVRAFGRGAKKTMPDWPDGYWPAQMFKPSDIAFGKDGSIYVNCASPGDSGIRVLIYTPF